MTPAYGQDDKNIVNLHKIRSLGLLKEMSSWNKDVNADRISAMIGVMILRESMLDVKVDGEVDEPHFYDNDVFVKNLIGGSTM